MTVENITLEDGTSFSGIVIFIADTVLILKDNQGLFYMINRDVVTNPKYKRLKDRVSETDEAEVYDNEVESDSLEED